MQAATAPAQDGRPVITEENDQPLGRAERRLLRRIYNGRTVPLVVDCTPFLTYKEATRYLTALSPHEREAAYAAMKNGAAKGAATKP